MKKFIFLISMALFAISAHAQLVVTNEGKTGVVMTTPKPQADLSVGSTDSYDYLNYSFGIWTKNYGNKSFNIGVKGYANTSDSYGRTFGVQGIGGAGEQGYNYGVLGGIGSKKNGAGIFGTVYNHTGVPLDGQYAGYFDGDTYVDGTLTVETVVTPSDIRLKENVRSISEVSSESGTLENVLNMNVISYNYKDRSVLKKAKSDTTSTVIVSQLEKKKISTPIHYGLSAQELQKIYPNLVVKGQDGYLGVNYVELVPILIRSIQELKAELDEVKSKDTEVKRARAASFEEDEDINLKDATSIPAMATLAQNTPNPFSERTTIRFTLPENAQNAFIYIFDMSGKMQKQIPVDSSMESVIIEGYELRAGMYIYSLVIGGKEIQTRRMILSK